MTKEEAIQVLKEISTTLKSWSGFTKYPQAIDMAIIALSAEVKENRPKPDYSYEADMVRRLKELLSAEAEDRHYIKIYADDEPSVKAEKLYQISGEQNSEVAKWVKEYFPLAEAVQVVRCKDCRWYRDTFFHSKVNPYCVKEFDEEFGALRSGITEDSFCSWGERKGGDDE